MSYRSRDDGKSHQQVPRVDWTTITEPVLDDIQYAGWNPFRAKAQKSEPIKVDVTERGGFGTDTYEAKKSEPNSIKVNVAERGRFKLHSYEDKIVYSDGSYKLVEADKIIKDAEFKELTEKGVYTLKRIDDNGVDYTFKITLPEQHLRLERNFSAV